MCKPRQKASDRNGQKALGAAAAAPEGPPGAVGAPGPAVVGTRRPPTSGWGPRPGQRQRPCLAARAARRAAAKHHFIGWVRASMSKIYVSSTARWFQPHQARTTVSKLPHDGLDLARDTSIGQFLIGIVLLCSVARQEGKHLIVFRKEARTWREELGTSNS